MVLLLAVIANTTAQNIKRPDSYNYTRAVEAINNNNTEEALDYLNKEIAENSENGYAFSWIASIRYYQKEYGRAITAADYAVKFIPKKDKEYRVFALDTRAAIYHYGLEKDEEAQRDYNQAVKEAPTEEKVYEARGQFYYEQEKYDLANADYRKMIQLNQGDVRGYMYLGRNMYALKQYSEAIEQYEYAMKLAPDYASAFSFRAESYIGLKQYPQAADDIVTALSIDKSDRKSFYYMQVMADSALIDIVTKLKIQVAKSPNDEFWPYCLGVVYEDALQYSNAITHYKTSLSKSQNDITAERIASCYDELGDYDKALEYIDQAISIDSTDNSYIFTKADILDNAGRTKEAISLMDTYISAEPEYYSGYYRRGWMKDHSGDTDGAIEDYSVAISLRPEYAYTYLNRGNLYRLKGETELAKADFEKVILLDTIPGYNNTAHYAYFYLGEKAKAKDFMDKALAKDDKGNYYDAACLYSIMGEKEKAIEYLRKALETGFRRFAHIARDRDLDNIREETTFISLIEEYKHKHEKEVELSSNEEGNYEEISSEIPFTKDGGVCKVKCTINGLPLHFIFDTGASDVSLSSVEATFMVKNDYLKGTDVVGKQNYLTADGEVSEGTVINLRQVRFGDLSLDNIKASVVKNQSAPLLLGQSVLARLGKIEIDNAKRVIKVTYKKPIK